MKMKKSKKIKLNLTCKYKSRPVRRTCNTSLVQSAFGIEFESGENIIAENVEIDYSPGKIVLFTGPSGSGKSSLLRSAAAEIGDCCLLTDDNSSGEAIIDLLGNDATRSMSLLGISGLSEAMLMLRSPSQLSEGQRYRFALAKCLAKSGSAVVADEWCAKLDRTTAKIISHNLRKLATRNSIGFLLATTHEDITEDLAPDVLVRCHGGGEVGVEYRQSFRGQEQGRQEQEQISFLGEFDIVKGALPDWAYFSRWHYRGHTLGPVKTVYLLFHRDEPVAIAIFGPGPLASSARNRCFKMSGMSKRAQARVVNGLFVSVSRFVIDPRYRAAGIAWRFLEAVCRMRTEPWIELVSEMAKTSRFCEKAGFKRIGNGLDKLKANKKSSSTGGFFSGENCTDAALRAYRKRTRFSRPAYYLFDNRQANKGNKSNG